MNIPRWFWPLLAFCMVAATASFAYRATKLNSRSASAWELKDGGVFNASTATLCGALDGKQWTCLDMRNGDTLSHLDMLIAAH